MKKLVTFVAGASMALAIAAPALAHVTVQPNEAVVGSFSRFVVRVPNEKDNAATTKVEVQLPPLAFMSFEPKDGWQRSEEMGEFEEPIEAFGEEITEGVVSVTWSGGEIGPGEFTEFGFSARMPDDETTIEFKALQTYDDGEVVRWTGAPDSDRPAATVTTYDIGAEEGQGQLGVLAQLAQGSGSDDGTEAEEAEASAEGTATTDDENDDEEDDEDDMGVVLGGIGAGLGAIALILALVSLRRKP